MPGLMRLIDFEDETIEAAYRAGARDYNSCVHLCRYKDLNLAAAWMRGYIDAKNKHIQEQLEQEKRNAEH
jgi:hypothetical protein